MRAVSNIIFFILACMNLKTTTQDDNLSLELLQVIFRHGDRVPDKKEIYKSDPNEPYGYEKIGYGQLTEIGMSRMFKFGQILRKRYNRFLGNYRFNKVYAYSSDLNRTKISLQAVLDGLYPLDPQNLCSKNAMRWSQIPKHYDDYEQGFLTKWFFESKSCLKFRKLFDEALNSPEIKNRIDKYLDLRNFLKNVTGDNEFVTSEKKIWSLYNNLKSALSMNLSIPCWYSDEIFKKFEDYRIILSDVLLFSDSMKRITAGSIIEKFLTNIENSNKKNDGGKKIYLYSGHDLNIETFTKVHNFSNVPSVPDYGSGIIVEKLRSKDEQTFLRMFYWTGVTEKMIPLIFEKIGHIISLADYKKMIKSLLPLANDCA